MKPSQAEQKDVKIDTLRVNEELGISTPAVQIPYEYASPEHTLPVAMKLAENADEVTATTNDAL